MKNFDLTGWTMFSNRHNSENYNSPDGKWMLKLGFPGFCSSREDLLREQSMCKKVYALGIPTPQVGEIVEVDRRLGLVYERIVGKKSISKCVGENLQNLESYMKTFAESCKKLHSTQCNEGDFESIESRYLRYLETSKFFTGKLADALRKILAETSKQSTCLHGDLQTGNLIVNNTGAYFIDLGEFSCGNPLFDLGCYYYFCHYLPDAYLQAAHYMDAASMLRCWKAFAKYYFGAETEDALAAVDSRIKPYALFTVLNFEHLMTEDANLDNLKKVLQLVLNDVKLDA